MDYSYLNLASPLLGLLAWTLPVLILLNIVKRKYCIPFLFTSLSACIITLFLQMLYLSHLVNKGDWSAMEDIIWSLIFVSAVLIIFTFVLNALAVFVHGKQKNK